MTNIQNTAVRTALTVKIDLGARLTIDQENIGLVSNLNDCFLISKEFSNNCETIFKAPKSFIERNPESVDANGLMNVCPIEGDKMIGANRDKGSITKVMDEYLPVIKFNFGDESVNKNFLNFISELGKNAFDITATGFSVFADVIANPSTTRDNVGALVLNSILEWKAIAENTEIKLTPSEVLALDIVELAKEYPCSHEVVIVDANMEEVYSFGLVPVMIEDFFWQPQHGNRFCIKEKSVCMSYNQARDAIKVLCPTLGQVMLETADFQSIKEDMMLLGLAINNEGMASVASNTNTLVFESTEDTDDYLM
ncbi:MAG: hypothetical protein ACRC0G_02970 [Fusobacteriaceae bacterium]